ncbi:MAG: tail fiber domain-containing protein [Anaerolineae bacterium]
MRGKRFWIVILGLALGLVLALGNSFTGLPAMVSAQDVVLQAQMGTSFTYQGRLTDGGSPANGTYDFRFRLYDAASGGTQVGSTVTKGDVTVTDGLFTVQLDFGSGVFTGDARYLEIGVRPGESTGAYTPLLPRQALTPAPYALALPGLWTQQNSTSPNLIGGYSGNSVSVGVVGATIGGGGSSIYPNQVTADYATIGGGYGNIVTATYATVGGGWSNTASSDAATVGGGHDNTASNIEATVSGGYGNIASGYAATVGGGYGNDATHEYTTIGGGWNNVASLGAATVCGGHSNEAPNWDATVGGGWDNTASGNKATVGGGYGNEAGGYAATIPGGTDNTASGDYSFAAGRRAQAKHDGSFVWADSNDFDFASVTTDTFQVRATGGVGFVLGIDSSGATTWSCTVKDGGSWSCSSDRTLKENLQLVDGGEVLRRLAGMPIYTWNGKGQDPGVRHMGPMAQDFHAAFGLGEDETHIATIDLDGVALAAIQRLYAQNQELAAKNADLEARADDLEARLAALEQGGVSCVSQLPSPWLLVGGLAVVGLVANRRRLLGGGR